MLSSPLPNTKKQIPPTMHNQTRTTTSMQLNADFRFPEIFAQIGRKLPLPLTHTTFLLALELARKQGLLEAPEEIQDKSFALHINDLGLDLFFRCEAGKFVRSKQNTADLHLYANAMSYVRLASGAEDADSLFFRRQLRMEGDTELGVAVKYWLDSNERPQWLQRLAEKLA